MIRCAGFTQASSAITLAVALLFSIGVKADDQIPHLRKIYEDCVVRAVGSHATAIRKARIDVSAATELAFQACQNEEQAVIAHLRAAGTTQVTADKALQGFKLRLQRTIRKAFLD